ALYDKLLNDTRAVSQPRADGSNAAGYVAALEAIFVEFPDDWERIRKEGLGYFQYSRVKDQISQGLDIEALLERGEVVASPLIYEDFLPVSAAGIFQSNLGDHAAQRFEASPNQRVFEQALGAEVLNEFDHY